jgi:hypothetical protein
VALPAALAILGSAILPWSLMGWRPRRSAACAARVFVHAGRIVRGSAVMLHRTGHV